MAVERIAALIIVFVLGAVLIVTGIIGFVRGSIEPWRLGSWRKPETVFRAQRPAAFWLFVSLYSVIGLVLITYVLSGLL